MFISDLSIKRPVFASVLMISLVTLGIFSYRQLAVDQFPDVEIPIISIVTVFPGAAPESVEREVSKPIEEAVNPISGVKHVNSISQESVSQVWVEFDLDVEVNDAAQEARAKIAAIRGDMPQGIEEPIVQKLDFGAMPIVSLSVRSQTLTPQQLTDLVEKKVQQRIQNIAGVGKVDVVGASTREINVDIDPARLEALGMGVDEVVAGLRAENLNTPLGRINRNGSEVPLRVDGKPARPQQFAGMVIGSRQGRPVTLGEVATITDGIEERRSLALVDGVPAIAIDVLKQSGANTVDTVDAVTREIARIEQELPAGTTVEMVRDGSIWIRDSVADVKETLVIGALLTVLIVFCFLNSWRSTVITGLTLPISVMSAFIIMNFMHMTLNIMTLMALSLAIGLLIDDAIVVRENIVRHLEHGEDHFVAARTGTSEIGLAVLATSASIIAVFVPVAFMKGIVGRFFFQFGITVAFAVAVSLLVSFTLDPMLSSRWHDPDIDRTGRRRLLNRILDRFNDWFDRTADRYRSLIAWALDHRKTILGAATAAFFVGLGIFFSLPTEFMSPTDQGEFQINLETAPDASLDETRDRLEAILAALDGFPEVVSTYATIGAGDTGTVRQGSVYVKLVPKGQRDRKQIEVQRAVRERLDRLAGVIVSFAEPGNLDTRKQLEASLQGEDLEVLKTYGARLKEKMYGIPGVVDLEMSLERETPEYRLVIDRERASDMGLSTAAIARTVGVLIGGEAVTTYEDEDGDAVDVRVRLPLSGRQDVSQVEALRLAVPSRTGAPALVPVAEVAAYRRTTTPAEIIRQDLVRQVVVSGNLDGLPLGTATAAVRGLVPSLDLPPGYRVVMGGQSEDMEEDFRNMAEALVLAVIMVYLILAAQFESFVDPLAIMLSLPLSIVGMAGMLALTGDTVNIMSLIGLIMLMGLVTKNAILLVDYTKVLRRRGKPRREALIEAGRTRLRPIIMTTTAMIFGMLPLALALGAGGEMRAPMARAVIGGLITSTLLTLIVVPVFYTVLDDLGLWIRRRFARRAGEAEAVVTAAALLLAVLAAPPAMARTAAPAGAPASVAAAGAGAEPDPVAPSPGGVLTFTLEEALTRAAAENHDIRKADEYRAWLRARYVEERSAAFPHLTVSAGALRNHDESQKEFFRNIPPEFGGLFTFEQDVTTSELSLNQALFTWGQVGAAIRGAKWALATGDDQLRRFRQAVARDVTAAFYDVLLAREFAAIAENDLAQKERHLDEARRRLEMGVATDYDVLSAEVAVANARPDVIRTANAVRTARQQLAYLLAVDGQEVDAIGELRVARAAVPAYDDVLAGALAHRPELAEIGHQRQVFEEVVRIQGAGDRPRLDLKAGYGWANIDVGDLATAGKVWSAGVYLTFPVFDGLKTRAKVAAARSDLRSTTIEEDKLRKGIALEVRTTVDAEREAAAIVEALEGTVEQAEKLLAMAEEGFRLGVKTRLEVDDAELNLVAARGNLARARRDLLVARTNVAWVSGTLGE